MSGRPRVESHPTQQVLVDRNVRIPTDNRGVTLSAVVCRPSGTEPVPALVSVYPYRSDAWIHEYMRPYMEWFAEHGYASVLVRVDSLAEGGLRYDNHSNGPADPTVYFPDPRVGPYSGIQCIGASSRLVLPLDQHQDDMRACTLTTDAFERDVVICGLPEVTVRIDGVAPEQALVERVVMRLTDVDQAGRSTMITTCLATSLATGELTPLLFWPTAYRVAAGHRLRVVVSDSAFPWLVPLTRPQAFTVVEMRLRVPILEDSDAMPIYIPPAPGPLSGLTYAESNWAIEEVPSRDGMRFKMWDRRDYTAPQGHQIREDASSEAYVSRDAPQDVVYRGERSILAMMRSGEKVVVTARVNTTHGIMIADAEVTIGDVRAFANEWRVPLSV
jgi:hypothetical protein